MTNIKPDEAPLQDVQEQPSTSPQQQENATPPSEPGNEPTTPVEPAHDYKEQYLRLYAEFDNYRKRTQKEKAEWIQMASRDIMLAMIEILDDSIRAEDELKKIDVGENSTLKNALDGVGLVFSKVKTILTQKGLAPLEVVGKPFNVDEHEAISEIPAEEHQKGTVIAEVQKGYALHGKVIKFAKVIVGK